MLLHVDLSILSKTYPSSHVKKPRALKFDQTAGEIYIRMLSWREIKSRRKVFILSCALLAAGGCYTSYILYNSEYLAEKRRRWDKFYKSLTSLADALSSSSDISATLTADLQQFLHSDSDEVPQSLRQLLKLSRSAEFQVAVTRLSGAVTQGVVKGITATTGDVRSAALSVAVVPADGTSKLLLDERIQGTSVSSVATLPERLLDKLFSDAGKGFASALVGKAVRSLVHAYFEHAGRASARQASKAAGQDGRGGVSGDGAPEGQGREWQQACLEVASSEQGKELISLVVSSFAVSSVSSFLEKTSDINMYDDMVSSITKEQYREPMAEILKSVCGGAVESLVRTSHEVLTADPQQLRTCSSKSPSSYKVPSSRTAAVQPRALFPIETSEEAAAEAGRCTEAESSKFSTPRPPLYEGRNVVHRRPSAQQTNWQAEVGNLLGRPETRQLVVDVAGAMSSQGIRAFTAVCLDMLRTMGGPKALDEGGGMSRSTVSVGALGPLRAVAAKALTASSVCLALCLHLVTGTQSSHVPGGGLLDGFHSH